VSHSARLSQQKGPLINLDTPIERPYEEDLQHMSLRKRDAKGLSKAATKVE